MGVTDLWSVLEPAKKPVASLSELQGKRVAIDVSIWIMGGIGVVGNDPRKLIICMRNLVFKLLRLLKEGIHPIFVLEGRAPALKYATLEKRRLARQAAAGGSEGVVNSSPFKAQGAVGGGSPSKGVSGLFHEIQSRWVKLVRLMDLPVVTSCGEAEAACAQLNALGKVDAVISDDSDSLLFGATTIFTNFSSDPTKDGQTQAYTMADIESQLGLTREHLVAYAMLAGCDYGDGVKGIGKERVLRLFDEMKVLDVLERLDEWRGDDELETLFSYKTLPKPRHCSRCSHLGNKKEHEKQACKACGDSVPCSPDSGGCECDYHQKMSRYEARCVECDIRQKAMKEACFPPAGVKDAFLKPTALTKKDEETNYSWPLPDYKGIQAFLQNEMNWSEETVRDKLLPVYTGLDLTSATNYKTECLSVPHKVKQKRVKRGVDMAEVEWNKIHGVPALVAPLVTLEDYNLFASHFPRLIDEYERQRSAAKLGSMKKVKQKAAETPRSRSQPQINRIFSAKRKLTYDSDKAKTVAMSTPSKSSETQNNGDEDDMLQDFVRINDSDEEKSPPAGTGKHKDSCDNTSTRDQNGSPPRIGAKSTDICSTPPKSLRSDSPGGFHTPPGATGSDSPEIFATPCAKGSRGSPPRFATPRKQLFPDTPSKFYTPRDIPFASPSKSVKRLHSQAGLGATPRKSSTRNLSSQQQPKISQFMKQTQE